MIRLAQISDLQGIVAIYNQAVVDNTNADTEIVKEDDRIGWFEEHNADEYPIYVYQQEQEILGWCSISPYRKGRKALAKTAEISYYSHYKYHRKGIATQLISYAIKDCERIAKRVLFAIILANNITSINLLKKFGFDKWGFLPDVAEFNGEFIGQVYMGKKIDDQV